MWCQGPADGTLLVHSDQFRGVKHSFTAAGDSPGDTVYTEPNPDYFQMSTLSRPARLLPLPATWQNARCC